MVRRSLWASSSLTSDVHSEETSADPMVRPDTEAGRAGLKTLIYSDSDDKANNQVVRLELDIKISLESLILAQDERWRRA